MSLTSGQIYEKDKSYYDDLATEYINKNLANIDDVCYIPFAMKTYYSRKLVKKINDNSFIVFDGYVKNIEKYSEYIKYNSDIKNSENFTLSELICYFGFEYSLNSYFRKYDEN